MNYERCSVAADKCPVIAHDAGLPVGSIVLERGRGTGRARASLVGECIRLEEKVSRVSDQAHGGGWKWTE